MKTFIALLVDADNVTAALVDEAVQTLTRSGAVLTVRRAYGGHEKLSDMKEVLRRHTFRAFVNHGKGTTDVALAVDAMDLFHTDALPPTVAIASSDADFAALVVRLRESGVRTLCFAHRAKADADALARAYDEVVFIDNAAAESQMPMQSSSPSASASASHSPSSSQSSSRSETRPDARSEVRSDASPSRAPAAKRAPAKRAPARKAANGARPAPETPTEPAKPRRAASRKTVAVPAPEAKGPSESAERILRAAPSLLGRTDVALNDVAQALRAAGLLGKQSSSLKFFDKLSDEFVLLQHPDRIRWIGAPAD